MHRNKEGKYMAKYIVFDVDGTLVDSQDGQEIIYESTYQTLKQLKENGHILAIATGRSMIRVLPTAKRLGIDNIISDGGNGMMLQGIIQYIKPLDQTIVRLLSQELLDKKIPFAYMVDSNKTDLYTSPQMLNYQDDLDCEGLNLIVDENFDWYHSLAYKVYMGIHQGEEDKIETVNAYQIMRYREGSLAYEPDDKYAGVKEFVKLYNGHIEDVIFFGDGLNDIGMFQKIPCSIAMGNGIDEVKALASFITKNIDDDGIQYACQYLKLI